MKKYQIVEEETVENIFEIEVPDDVAAKGDDAILDYWYNLDEPGMYLIESNCIDCDAVTLTDITNVEKL